VIPIKFGEWLPDLPYYANPGLVEAKNVLPVDGSYAQLREIQTDGDALTNDPQGAFAAVAPDGSSELYAGDATKLYQRSATWTDRSGATYTTPSTGYWSFTQFDEKVIASNFSDEIQVRDAGSGANFAQLSPDAPRARCVGTINRFVIGGDTDDIVNGAVPNRAQWCTINDATDWPTPNSITARTRQAGEQFLNVAFGAVTGISSGQFFGKLFQQRGITRATYQGGDVVFQFDEYEKNRGLWFPQSLISIGSLDYFIAADGFYVTDGQSVTPIGNAKVDRFFFDSVNETSRQQVTATLDFRNRCIYWCYPSIGSDTPDRLLIYNYQETRWSHAELSVQMLFNALSAGYTLEQLDALFASIDAGTISLDSSFWAGGLPILGVFSGKSLGAFSGDPLDATFETGEQDAESLIYIDSVRPLVTGNPTAITVALASRDRQDNESRTFGTHVARTARTGVCDFRTQGRYISAQTLLAGGFDRAMGLQVYPLEGDGL
jgi:hypothetical protein